LNPGPHGPEIQTVSSTETVFEGVECVSTGPQIVVGLFLPAVSPGLLQEN